MPSSIITHGTQEGIKGGKNRCKQRFQGATTTTNDNNDEMGASTERRTLTTTRNDRRQARPLQTTSKGFSRRLAQTMYTPSGTSSRTMT
jgi:hypothetical protein